VAVYPAFLWAFGGVSSDLIEAIKKRGEVEEA